MLAKAVEDFRAGDFSTDAALWGLHQLFLHWMSQQGQPKKQGETETTQQLKQALAECTVSWENFDGVITACRGRGHFGWPCLNALPIVANLLARYPTLQEVTTTVSKLRPASYEPVRKLYHEANEADRPRIVLYLMAHCALQMRGQAPTMMAHCDKWPVYVELVQEFSGKKAAHW